MSSTNPRRRAAPDASATTTTTTAPDTLRLPRLPTCRRWDVIYVRRSLPGRRPHDPILYHHAGLVTRVDGNGRPTHVLHFDPVFDRADFTMENLRAAAIGGRSGRPQVLHGAELLRVFPPLDTFVFSSAMPGQEGAIRRRVAHAQATERRYVLWTNNCQHFATEMQTGIPHSEDMSLLARAFRQEGLPQGFAAAARFANSQFAHNLCNVQLFNDHGVGRFANIGLSVLGIIIVLIILLAILAITTTVRTTAAYLRDNNQHLVPDQDEDGDGGDE